MNVDTLHSTLYTSPLELVRLLHCLLIHDYKKEVNIRVLKQICWKTLKKKTLKINWKNKKKIEKRRRNLWSWRRVFFYLMAGLCLCLNRHSNGGALSRTLKFWRTSLPLVLYHIYYSYYYNADQKIQFHWYRSGEKI